eukprot:TRINITY_DN7060_c0_g3_i1.p2 TRINITY_DN7060_c0_g3~~TRINITY_DN7060_c0_g3_i1.p2  ORF type:complete len:245 (+),score=55.48 TRINITY_DN7060_c0_g3_i1:85-819(+)
MCIRDRRSTHLIGCFEAFMSAGSLVVVMEYAEGGTLAQYLAQRRKEGAVTVRHVYRLFLQMLCGVHVLHRHQLVHRDLKSANVLLSGPPDQLVAKVCDFGMAGKQSVGSMSSSVQALGTICWAAPEVLQHTQAGPSADVWCFRPGWQRGESLQELWCAVLGGGCRGSALWRHGAHRRGASSGLWRTGAAAPALVHPRDRAAVHRVLAAPARSTAQLRGPPAGAGGAGANALRLKGSALHRSIAL